MELSFTDADQWYETYESAPLNRRYEILVETLDQTLSENFIEESGLVSCLLEMLDELTSRNLIEQLLFFTDKIKTKQSDLYKKEYHYFDNFLVKYYLYRDDKDKVAESLARFMEDPVPGIDYMIALLDYLQFYGYTDITVKLCRRTYLPVMKSPELMPGSEWDLGYLIFIDMVEKAYRHIQSGETVDWEAFVEEAEKYGYGGGQESAADIRDCLTGELEGGEAFAASFRENREESTYALVWAFLKHMLDQKDMPFVCSNHITNGVLEFLAEKKPRSKSISPNTYFGFSRSEFEPYLAQEMGGFMSMQQARAMGTLWGIVYLYDFLLSKEIIADSMHRGVIRTVSLLKKDAIKGFSKSLWRYDFVHRWNPPDSVSGDDFAAESELSSQTIENQDPLGDELPRGPMDMFSQLIEMAKPSELVVPARPIKLPATGKKSKGKRKSGARKSSGTRRPKKKKRKRKK
ncbi:hypothetical protein ACFL6S_03995 [Candidatus Poribacteria bacterium]